MFRTVARGSRMLAVSTLLLIGACRSSTETSGPVELALQPASASSPAIVRVTGLSGDDLSRLRRAVAPEKWADVLKVTVDGSDIAIVGRHVVTDTAVEFHPRFPFDPGRSYFVRFDPSGLIEAPRPLISEAVVSLPAVAAGPRVVVTEIHPAAHRWPANMLRFYIHFSGPMSRAGGVGFVHLVGEDGEDVADAFLPAEIDFWNDDRTRYTVFFDPGRVKRGILPNRQMGRALVPGRRYTILVDAGWRDESGRPLREAYRHEFTAAPPIEQALDTAQWQVASPQAGTREALVITFPTLMDRPLVARALSVALDTGEPATGAVEVNREATEWRFTPRDNWRGGRHAIVAASILEDPAGNRIGRAFEVDSADQSRPPEPEQYRVPFEVARAK